MNINKAKLAAGAALVSVVVVLSACCGPNQAQAAEVKGYVVGLEYNRGYVKPTGTETKYDEFNSATISVNRNLNDKVNLGVKIDRYSAVKSQGSDKNTGVFGNNLSLNASYNVAEHLAVFGEVGYYVNSKLNGSGKDQVTWGVGFNGKIPVVNGVCATYQARYRDFGDIGEDSGPGQVQQLLTTLGAEVDLNKNLVGVLNYRYNYHAYDKLPSNHDHGFGVGLKYRF